MAATGTEMSCLRPGPSCRSASAMAFAKAPEGVRLGVAGSEDRVLGQVRSQRVPERQLQPLTGICRTGRRNRFDQDVPCPLRLQRRAGAGNMAEDETEGDGGDELEALDRFADPVFEETQQRQRRRRRRKAHPGHRARSDRGDGARLAAVTMPSVPSAPTSRCLRS